MTGLRQEYGNEPKFQLRPGGDKAVSSQPIFIDLDRPHTYAHGDKITGKVFLRNVAGLRVSRVAIAVDGRAKTKIYRSSGQSTAVYRGRVPLLQFGQMLGSPEQKPGSQVVAMPFSLTLPKSPQDLQSIANQNQYWHIFGSRSPFESSHEHPLPPSFELNHHSESWKVEPLQLKAGQRRFQTYVTYMLVATANVSGNDVYCQKLLKVTSLPPASFGVGARNIQARQLMSVRSLLLLPENQGRELTFKERTKSVFQPSNLPDFYFEATVSMPNRMALGESLRFELNIGPQLEKSSAPAVPLIELIDFEYKIKAVTEVRSYGSLSGDVTNGAEENVLREIRESQRAGKKLIKSIATLDKGNEFKTVYSTGKITGLAPSFTTYNIVRYYLVKGKWTLLIAGEELKINRQCPLQVFGAHSQILGNSRSAPPPTQMAIDGEVPPAEEDLPSYQDAVASSSSAPPRFS